MQKIVFKFIFLISLLLFSSFLCMNKIEAETVKCVYKTNVYDNSNNKSADATITINFDILSGTITRSTRLSSGNTSVSPAGTLSNTLSATNFIKSDTSTETIYYCPPLSFGCMPDDETNALDGYQCGIFISDVKRNEAGDLYDYLDAVYPDPLSSNEIIIKKDPEKPDGETSAARDCNYSLKVQDAPAAAKITLRYAPSNNSVEPYWYWALKDPNNNFKYKDYSLTINSGDSAKIYSYIKENNKCPEVSATCKDDSKSCVVFYGNSGETPADIGTGNDTIDDIENEIISGDLKPGDGIAATLGNAFEIATGAISCEELLNTGEGAENTVLDILHKVFSIMKIAALAILLVFTAIDFVIAIAKSDGDAIKGATKNLPKRLIAAFFIFILPSIIELILTIISLNNGSCNF